MKTTLSKVNTILLESNAYDHQRFFYDTIASKFDDTSSLLDTFMYHIIDEYVYEWDDRFVENPKEMLDCYFDGDVLDYVNQLHNDMAHVKNIVVNFYLAYLDVFISYVDDLYQNGSDISIEEAVKEVFYGINDEHLIENPDAGRLLRLSKDQRQEFNYVLTKAGLEK